MPGFNEPLKPREDAQETVMMYAGYAGHASAMAIMAYMQGNTERAAVWEAECTVWQRRVDEIVDKELFGFVQLRMDALSAEDAAARAIDPIGVRRALEHS